MKKETKLQHITENDFPCFTKHEVEWILSTFERDYELYKSLAEHDESKNNEKNKEKNKNKT